MRTRKLTTSLLCALIALASCGSPPKPPTVKESDKRPVNSQAGIELQVCKNDLQNTRLRATESSRLAETTAATLANMAARQQLLAALQEPDGQSVQANRIYTVRFKQASARVVLPPEARSAIAKEAKLSPLVLLRGRTDGTRDLTSESRIARERASAVRDYLVAAGVDATRIRATYQPAGDHVADNATAEGRSRNRRVEIEMYRALPVALSASAAAQP